MKMIDMSAHSVSTLFYRAVAVVSVVVTAIVTVVAVHGLEKRHV
ncbi:hypothetical protein ACFQVB_12150 [Paraburkholderia humisilvae]|uniref:Uncharacterized protein n=1 Tax=Paraburkholderia humisilvae TaxID=627669 RepID=A0A6J5D554_9BURK|nr:hypothetical protein LMG29542_00945 [Paraburkholderia humisilvae]